MPSASPAPAFRLERVAVPIRALSGRAGRTAGRLPHSISTTIPTARWQCWSGGSPCSRRRNPTLSCSAATTWWTGPTASPHAALLGRLRAPLGVYAILGNHDYRPGGEALAAQLAAAGPVLLRNEAVRLGAPAGDPLWVIGLDDALRGRPDFVAASARVPAGEFALLLAHEPDIADQLNSDRVGLQLSGHTHGGQVVLPGFGPPLLPALGRRYLRGLRHDSGHPVYTSRGLGAVPPYLRLNCPPR
ncbi:MAG: hypothetical protein U0232_24320 [Thermomicrobiales bacterium]